MRALLQSDTAGHYRASGDQANLEPMLEPPLKRRNVWARAARISQRFVNKKNCLKCKVIAFIVTSWSFRSKTRIFIEITTFGMVYHMLNNIAREFFFDQCAFLW